jgi:hypothetical protein
MLPGRGQIVGTFMERFIDATYKVYVDGYDHSLTPLGYDITFTFNLKSDGRMQLEIEDFDAYSSMKVSHLMIIGEWELMIFRPDRFAIRINNPDIRILMTGGDEKKYIAAMRNQHLLWVSGDGAHFNSFPGYETQQSETPIAIEPSAKISPSTETPDTTTEELQTETTNPEKYGIRKPVLESPSQLPEIAGNHELIFVWDQDEWDSLILYGRFVVWREWTGFEVFERFEEVLGILKQKYGKRLIDVVPTLRSLYCLYGDRFIGSGVVESARRALLKNASDSENH